MAKFKNLSLITVLYADSKANTLEIIKSGMLQKTDGNPLYFGIPVDDTTMHGQCKILNDLYIGFKAYPPKFSSESVEIQKLIVTNLYNKNVGFIQSVARDRATATGEVGLGIDVVLCSGYLIKSHKSATTNNFRATNEGPGQIGISTKSVGRNASYIRQYGQTTAKDIPPQPENCCELIITPDVDFTLCNLKSGGIYAFREAIVKSAGSGSKKKSAPTNTDKKVTKNVLSKTHKAVFNAQATTNYIWSDWIYIVAT